MGDRGKLKVLNLESMKGSLFKKIRNIFENNSSKPIQQIKESKSTIQKHLLAKPKNRDALIKKWLDNYEYIPNYLRDELKLIESDPDDFFSKWIENHRESKSYHEEIQRELDRIGRYIVFDETCEKIAPPGDETWLDGFKVVPPHKYQEIVDKYGEWSLHYAVRKKKTKQIMKKYVSDDVLNRITERIFKIRGCFPSSPSGKLPKILKEEMGKDAFNCMKREIQSLYGGFNNLVHFLSNYYDEKVGQEHQINTSSNFCRYCGRKFYPITFDDSLLWSYPINESIEEIEYCSICLKSAIKGVFKEAKNRDEMKKDLRELVDALGYIPAQDYMSLAFFRRIPKDRFHDVMRVLIEISPYEPDYYTYYRLKDKSLVNFYKQEFGSWFKALVESGVLEDDSRRLVIGTQCLALDGHECLSLEEKRIDDWLYEHNIHHVREPRYPVDEDLNPNGLMRADWAVNDVLIEYFGLAGDADYDRKAELKRAICKNTGIKLIALYRKDLNKLSSKLRNLK